MIVWKLSILNGPGDRLILQMAINVSIPVKFMYSAHSPNRIWSVKSRILALCQACPLLLQCQNIEIGLISASGLPVSVDYLSILTKSLFSEWWQLAIQTSTWKPEFGNPLPFHGKFERKKAFHFTPNITILLFIMVSTLDDSRSCTVSVLRHSYL